MERNHGLLVPKVQKSHDEETSSPSLKAVLPPAIAGLLYTGSPGGDAPASRPEHDEDMTSVGERKHAHDDESDEPAAAKESRGVCSPAWFGGSPAADEGKTADVVTIASPAVPAAPPPTPAGETNGNEAARETCAGGTSSSLLDQLTASVNTLVSGAGNLGIGSALSDAYAALAERQSATMASIRSLTSMSVGSVPADAPTTETAAPAAEGAKPAEQSTGGSETAAAPAAVPAVAAEAPHSEAPALVMETVPSSDGDASGNGKSGASGAALAAEGPAILHPRPRSKPDPKASDAAKAAAAEGEEGAAAADNKEADEEKKEDGEEGDVAVKSEEAKEAEAKPVEAAEKAEEGKVGNGTGHAEAAAEAPAAAEEKKPAEEHGAAAEKEESASAVDDDKAVEEALAAARAAAAVAAEAKEQAAQQAAAAAEAAKAAEEALNHAEAVVSGSSVVTGETSATKEVAEPAH